MRVLADMRSYCHPLKGFRDGQFAVHLWGGFRLIFVPDSHPLPISADGAVDIAQVTSVEILSVENYHE